MIIVFFVEIVPKRFITFFYDCSYSNQFWKAFKIIWFGLSGENVELTFQDILVGKLDKVSLKLQVSYC